MATKICDEEIASYIMATQYVTEKLLSENSYKNMLQRDCFINTAANTCVKRCEIA